MKVRTEDNMSGGSTVSFRPGFDHLCVQTQQWNFFLKKG